MKTKRGQGKVKFKAVNEAKTSNVLVYTSLNVVFLSLDPKIGRSTSCLGLKFFHLTWCNFTKEDLIIKVSHVQTLNLIC